MAACGRIGFVPASSGDAMLGAGDGVINDGVAGNDMFAPSADTYIVQNSTVHNDGDAQLFIGRSAGGNASATLLQFDLSSISAGATVTSASLRLYQFTSMGMGTIAVDAERITSTWNVTTVLYSTRPTWDTTPLATQTVALNTPGFTTWDVTPAVQQWIAGTAQNFGLVVESPMAANGQTIQMVSQDNGQVTQRPQLFVVVVR